MKLLATKRPPAEHVSPDELIDALERRRADLRRRDAELLAAQLKHERAGVSPAEPRDDLDPRDVAREILGGDAPHLAAAESASAQLRSIILQRQAIGNAIEILGREETAQRAIAVGLTMQETGADWTEITRRRVAALIELRKANRAAEKFKAQLRRIAGGPVALKCDFQGAPYFGVPVVGDRVYLYLQACIAAGYISKDEIDAS